MSTTFDSFFELIRVSIGTQQQFIEIPNTKEWNELFELATKQSLAGILFVGFEQAMEKDSGSKPTILFNWIGTHQRIISQNVLQNKRAKELYELFRKEGFQTCVLKGQGTATYYDRPELRQSGDIDLWVNGDRDEIVGFAKSKGVRVESVDIKDSTMHFFDDVMVEVHFRPNCMFNPIVDKKLQSFFREAKDIQFNAYDEKLGFAHTTIEFDLVYSLVHIYRHIFSEGIGLRQLVDYYYILKHSETQERTMAYQTICSFGMKTFAGGIMYILMEKFGMSKEYALCGINKQHGAFLLREILIGGNFGHYDTRYRFAGKNKKFKRGIEMLKRNLHFMRLYPSEVLWSPVWKLWHWCWRKQKGYL